MPVDMSRYPANWREIVAEIRTRAGNRCEWCGAVNRAWGWRDDAGYFHEVPQQPLRDAGFTRPPFRVATPHGKLKIIEIILTTAHLGIPHADGTPGDKHDKLDCRPENLAYLCQRCHLNYDREEHKANAARTRRQKVLDAGQMELM